MRSEKEIGQIIRQLRGTESLRSFARRCDTTHTTIDNLEKGFDFRTGKPAQAKMATLQKIATACNVPISYIVGEESGKSSKEELKIALFGGVGKEIGDEILQDVLEYAGFVTQRYLREKNMKFAKRLRIAMFKAKLNATELSKKAKIAASTIAGYVDGQKSPNPGDRQMQTLAKALNVDLTWLESGEKEGAPFDLKEALFPDAQEVSDREWKRILDFAQVPYDERGFEDSEEMPFDASGHQTYRMDIAARGGGVKLETVTDSELDALEKLPDLKVPGKS